MSKKSDKRLRASSPLCWASQQGEGEVRYKMSYSSEQRPLTANRISLSGPTDRAVGAGGAAALDREKVMQEKQEVNDGKGR